MMRFGTLYVHKTYAIGIRLVLTLLMYLHYKEPRTIKNITLKSEVCSWMYRALKFIIHAWEQSQ